MRIQLKDFYYLDFATRAPWPGLARPFNAFSYYLRWGKAMICFCTESTFKDRRRHKRISQVFTPPRTRKVPFQWRHPLLCAFPLLFLRSLLFHPAIKKRYWLCHSWSKIQFQLICIISNRGPWIVRCSFTELFRTLEISKRRRDGDTTFILALRLRLTAT